MRFLVIFGWPFSLLLV